MRAGLGLRFIEKKRFSRIVRGSSYRRMLRQEMPGWCERANVPVRGQKKEGKWESHEDLRKTWPDPMDISIAKTLARGSSRVEGLRLQSCWHGRLGRLLLQ